MWRILSSITKHSGSLGSFSSQLTEWAPHHKSLLFFSIAGAMVTALLIVVLFQHSATSLQQQKKLVDTVQATAISQGQTAHESDLRSALEPGVSGGSDAQAQSLPSGQASTKTEVTVNNQAIPVPDNGSVHTTVPSDNGSAQVNVTVDAHSTHSSNSTAASSVQVYSNSSQSQVSVEHTP